MVAPLSAIPQGIVLIYVNNTSEAIELTKRWGEHGEILFLSSTTNNGCFYPPILGKAN